MAQYKDGDSKTIAGVTYVRQGGVWLPPSSGVQIKPADPEMPYKGPIAAGHAAAAPYEAPKAVADINNTQAQTGKTTVDAATVRATLPYAGPKAAAETSEAQANAAIAQNKLREEQIAAQKADLEKFGGSEQVDQLVNAVERAKKLLGNSTTGIAGSVAGHIPGTDAYDLRKIIEQEVRGNVFLQRIQALKDENPSPNGGTGIGRIMQAEIPMITGAMGTLDLGMKGSELLNSLDQIERGALRVKARVNGDNPDDPAVQRKYAIPPLPGQGGGTTATTPPSPEQQAQFFQILQSQGADAADAYLRQFGLAMKDKTAANRPYTPALSLPANDKSYANSYVGQALSGANEGLAGVLGAPVDLATAALNLVPKGINAVANTNIPEITNPVLGSQQWKQILSGVGSILPSSEDPSKQFVRRVGESVGSAAVPGMFAGSLPKFGAAILSGVGGGIGGATAQQIAPGNPLAEMGGELIGGGLTGFGIAKAGQRAAQRTIESSVPTVDELKQQATNLYNQAETRGVTATPEQTQQLANQFHKTLVDEGQLGPSGAITNADTNTSKAYNLIQQYAGQEMTPKQMNTVRTVLADSRQSSDPADRRLGSILLDQFDNFASPLAPEFDQARAVASRYLQAQDLERARELAAARASQFTGSGFENALRTEYRGLDRNNIKGNNYFSPDVTGAIQTVARGTPTSNLMRGVGRLAPTGPVSAMGDIVPALGIGAMTSSPTLGGMFGAGMAGAGILGRTAATRMGIRAADQAELIARNGGALQQAPLLSDDAQKYAAWLAAVQQIKYGNPLLPQN